MNKIIKEVRFKISELDTLLGESIFVTLAQKVEAVARQHNLINPKVISRQHEPYNRCWLVVIEGEKQRKLSHSMKIAKKMRRILEKA